LQKEVERRRRGNINDGINELGRIVPNGSGEKAKGAILSRAVQYIHHLKENEARNIEKWTLEKLLMDQAMGDLQAQLEEMRRLWEEERAARTRAESELDVLRGLKGSSATDGAAAPEKATETAAAAPAASEGEAAQGGEEESGRPGKRQRTD
jgi:bHLH factor